jgi:hypothetical protein
MKYTICHKLDDKGKQALLKFWNEWPRERDFDKNYRWTYEGNPAGQAITFLVRDNDSTEYVGCLSMFPRKFSIDGINLRVAVLADMFVSKEHRRSAIFPRKFSVDSKDPRAGLPEDLFVSKEHRVVAPSAKLVNEVISIVQEDRFDLLYAAFPNKKSDPCFKRSGFNRLGPTTRIAKVVKTSEQLQKRRFCKYLIRPVSVLLDVALKLFAFETWYRFKGGFVCEEMSNFDERFDNLWMRSKSRFRVVSERSSELLRWKYVEQPDTEFKIYAIFNSKKTELKGYIVTLVDGISILIKDLVLPEDKTTARIFVSNFLRHVKKHPQSSIVLNFLENKEIVGFLKIFGFVKRPSDRAAYYYCSERLLKRFPVLEDLEAWLLTNFDMDN